MLKKHSLKFWIIFWLIAVLFLAGWYVFLQVKNRNIENLKPFLKLVPIGSERRNEIATLMDIYSQIGGFPPKDGQAGSEKNLLVLFQNDLELRPGGGFIGAFGVLKMKDGKIENIEVQDTGNFDKNIPDTQTPPAPLQDILDTEAWKLRDSNWSPDFRTNAEKAEYFYKLGRLNSASQGGGAENIDGVIAINTRVLNSILAVTGPVQIEGYPGEYRDENAILQLEYQVEKGYAEQGIEKTGRKNIMGELADVLTEKIQSLSFSQQLALAKKMEEHLQQKDIQMFFNDENLQKEIENISWGGQIKNFSGDYLMAVDANLLSLKSDYCIKRKMDYSVDLSGEKPQAVLNITYEHTCRAKDWMTTDYRDWLRVYAPKDSFLEEASGQNGDVHPPTNATENINNLSSIDGLIGGGVQYSEELGKKVFGMLVFVPVGESKTITLKYQLAQSVKNSDYHLLVQKQSGSGDVPINISIKKPDGSEIRAQENLTGDKEF